MAVCRLHVLDWAAAAAAADKGGRGWWAAVQSPPPFRTISKSNQDSVRKSACDHRGYHVINQLTQGGGAINTTGKRLGKGLKLTCNLTGQGEGETEGRGSNGSVGLVVPHRQRAQPHGPNPVCRNQSRPLTLLLYLRNNHSTDLQRLLHHNNHHLKYSRVSSSDVLWC